MNDDEIKKKTGVEIETTDVTHIVRTHMEGKEKSHITTLELLDNRKWIIKTVSGDLVQLDKYKKLLKA